MSSTSISNQELKTRIDNYKKIINAKYEKQMEDMNTSYQDELEKYRKMNWFFKVQFWFTTKPIETWWPKHFRTISLELVEGLELLAKSDHDIITITDNHAFILSDTYR